MRNKNYLTSIPIPLFIACTGGGGAPDNLAHAQQSPTLSIAEARTPANIPNTPAAETVGTPHWTEKKHQLFNMLISVETIITDCRMIQKKI